ncbi:MAG TPA: FHA domain-containing protein [Methylomirabilota bacterium]|nr:FHA domain-containing protein [Methylomirabilota bacterium]
MARLLVKIGWQTHTFELRRGVNRVGRAEGNEVQIPDPSVSSFHCVLDVSDIATTVRDLGSTNGTFIDGNQMGPQVVVLQRGQAIRFGHIDASFDCEDVNIAIPELTAPEMPTQVFFADGTAGCLNHTSLRATFFCPHCSEFYCDQCVRRMSFQGRQRTFCPHCSKMCEPAPEPEGVSHGRKRTFGSMIRDTVRLVFKQ